MVSKGIQEFIDSYTTPIVVELRRKGSDGRNFAVRMHQPPGMLWQGFAGGLPTGQTEMNPEAKKEQTDEIPRDPYQIRMRRLVAAAIFELRTPSPNGKENWEAIRFVEGREPDPKADPPEISMDVLDYVDNVTKCFNALVMDVSEGGELAATEAEGFRHRARPVGRVRRAR